MFSNATLSTLETMRRYWRRCLYVFSTLCFTGLYVFSTLGGTALLEQGFSQISQLATVTDSNSSFNFLNILGFLSVNKNGSRCTVQRQHVDPLSPWKDTCLPPFTVQKFVDSERQIALFLYPCIQQPV